MNPLTDEGAILRRNIEWAALLGRLSAARHGTGPSDAIADSIQPIGAARMPGTIDNSRHRQQVREHSDAKFRAHEFISAP
jgi:hypothetical protein